jgi:hypothetical protein
MEVFFIILGAVVAVGVILRLLHRPDDDAPQEVEPQEVEPLGECCGQHTVCERDSLLTSMSSGIEYFDDEELDALANRDPQTYTEAEVEALREVLLTLQPSDVAPWARSIQLRQIALPDDVRDELLLLVGEARQSADAAATPRRP